MKSVTGRRLYLNFIIMFYCNQPKYADLVPGVSKDKNVLSHFILKKI